MSNIDEDMLPLIVDFCRLDGFVLDILRVKYEGNIYEYYKYKMLQFVKINTQEKHE